MRPSSRGRTLMASKAVQSLPVLIHSCSVFVFSSLRVFSLLFDLSFVRACCLDVFFRLSRLSSSVRVLVLCLFVCSFVWLIVCLIVCSFVVLIVCLLVCLFACLFVFLAFVLFVPSNDCLFAPLFLLPLFLCVVFLVVFWKTVVVIVSLYHFPLNSLQSKDITQMGKRPCLLHGEGCSKYPCELHGFAAGFSCTSVSSLNQKSESATSAIKEPSNIRQMGLKHWQMKARPTEANGNRLRKTNIHT